MGLDMYLSAEKYVSGWDHSDDEADKPLFATITGALGVTDLVAEGSPSATVSVNVMYWRKANAIHSWFVTNVQDGVDECQRTYVGADQLEELKDTCEAALEAYNSGDKDAAATILAPTSGFFFGSTDVDEWYAEDLRRTVERLNLILAAAKDTSLDFYYQASW